MNTDVKTILTSGAALTDAALERLLPSATTIPHSIHRAMRHSTFAGGKRLRPVLCMEAARMVAAPRLASETWDAEAGLPPGAADLGAALEMVHTYSLIHDDLPALDNDDLRRGQPTCHVVYGEAIAILAGDALQTLAFQTLAQLPAPAATIVAILHDFSLAIGTGVGKDTGIPPGMIGGQVMDIEGEGQKPTADLVERIHRAKTGALITTSIVSGGLLGLTSAAHVGFITPKDATPEEAARIRKEATETQLAEQHAKRIDTIARLRTFGEKAGLAFQIVDDILDMTQSSEQLGKTAGKDTASDKATWPAVYGIEQSEKDAAELIADAFAALEPFGEAAAPLKALASYLVERKN
jgi:geranylgeranyl diphosphate synthase type II